MRLDEKDGIIKDKEVIITSMSASKTRETSELDELKVLVQARDREIDALNTQVNYDGVSYLRLLIGFRT